MAGLARCRQRSGRGGERAFAEQGEIERLRAGNATTPRRWQISLIRKAPAQDAGCMPTRLHQQRHRRCDGGGAAARGARRGARRRPDEPAARRAAMHHGCLRRACRWPSEIRYNAAHNKGADRGCRYPRCGALTAFQLHLVVADKPQRREHPDRARPLASFSLPRQLAAAPPQGGNPRHVLAMERVRGRRDGQPRKRPCGGRCGRGRSMPCSRLAALTRTDTARRHVESAPACESGRAAGDGRGRSMRVFTPCGRSTRTDGPAPCRVAPAVKAAVRRAMSSGRSMRCSRLAAPSYTNRHGPAPMVGSGASRESGRAVGVAVTVDRRRGRALLVLLHEPTRPGASRSGASQELAVQPTSRSRSIDAVFAPRRCSYTKRQGRRQSRSGASHGYEAG